MPWLANIKIKVWCASNLLLMCFDLNATSCVHWWIVAWMDIEVLTTIYWKPHFKKKIRLTRIRWNSKTKFDNLLMLNIFVRMCLVPIIYLTVLKWKHFPFLPFLPLGQSNEDKFLLPKTASRKKTKNKPTHKMKTPGNAFVFKNRKRKYIDPNIFQLNPRKL